MSKTNGSPSSRRCTVIHGARKEAYVLETKFRVMNGKEPLIATVVEVLPPFQKCLKELGIGKSLG